MAQAETKKTASVSRTARMIVIVGALIVLIATLLWSAAQSRRRGALMQADPEGILADPVLAPVAMTLGRNIYAAHCQSCHGADGKGSRARGTPDFTDGDQLFGNGLVSEIEQITLHGIRSGDPKAMNLADMPAYATAKPYAREPIPPLRAPEIHDIVNYLVSLHGDDRNPASVARGRLLFVGAGGCYDCHSQDAAGDPAIGAPNLADDIWLYGDGSPGSIYRSIASGHAGISPAFARRLTPVEARAAAVYVAAFARALPHQMPRM